MNVNVEINTSDIADEVNMAVGRDVETGETVERWMQDNASRMADLLSDAITEEIVEAY